MGSKQEMGSETKETDARTEDRTIGPPQVCYPAVCGCYFDFTQVES